MLYSHRTMERNEADIIWREVVDEKRQEHQYLKKTNEYTDILSDARTDGQTNASFASDNDTSMVNNRA